MTISRRHLLRGVAASAATIPLAARADMGIPGLFTLLNSVNPLHVGSANATAFFEDQAGISTAFDRDGNPKPTQLQNVGGSSIDGWATANFNSRSSSLSFFFQVLDVPRTVQRVFTAYNNFNFEHFSLTLLPSLATVQIYASDGSSAKHTLDMPAWHVKVAAGSGASLKVNSWIIKDPMLWVGAWHNYNFMLNSIYAGAAATLHALHFIKGRRDPQNENMEKQKYIGFPLSDSVSYPLLNLPKIDIPFGISGAPGMLNFGIGAVPGASGNSLQNTYLESLVWSPRAADPIWSASNVILNNGNFVKPNMLGWPSFFANDYVRNPIHNIGGVLNIGGEIFDPYWGSNGGIQALDIGRVDSLWVADQSFWPMPGNNLLQSGSDILGPWD
jgi:hypothetical protein